MLLSVDEGGGMNPVWAAIVAALLLVSFSVLTMVSTARAIFRSNRNNNKEKDDESKQSTISGRDPSWWEKQTRRYTVFRMAFSVFVDYKWNQRKAKRLKKKLGLDPDDAESNGHPDILELWSVVHKRNAEKMLVKIQKLEGFWVKVGQYVSSRGDVMPLEYLETLGVLQDSMPPKSWADTWQTIVEEIGEDPALLARIQSIDRTPLSTASLAQVHKAVLKIPITTPTTTNGYEEAEQEQQQFRYHDVVLKVQHRGVAALMLQDMENLRVILEMLAWTDKDLDFGPVIREYNMEVCKELDFRIEEQNMKDVALELQKANIKAIVPNTCAGFVMERLMVMDYCDGFAVRDIAKLDEHKVDRDLLLERIVAAWAVQMHVGGVFNCDPHMGNILVSTAVPGDPSVPVLLDFGLTKRLDPQIKLAFARLMHASYENDVDGLLQSFDEMGLKMNRHDPFQDMANMQRGFGDTVKQSEARESLRKRRADFKQRREAQRADAGLKKGEKLRSPVDAWPSELVFFLRVTAMLRGLCSRLEVSYPYLKTMAMAAKNTLQTSVPEEEHATDFIHYSTKSAVATPMQIRLIEALHQLKAEGHVAGVQVCVLKHGKEVAQLAAGTLGTSNPRPVTPTTLFNVFSVSKGVLTIGALHLLQDGLIEGLDDPVARYWQAFESKPTITIRHLLSHQAGLANVYPENATLDTLLDWSAMKDFIASEEAAPSHEPGTETNYHALSYAWLVGGLIEAVTGKPYEDYLDKILPYNTKEFPGEDTTRRNLFLAGISEEVDNHKDLAVLSIDRRAEEAAKKAGIDLQEIMNQQHDKDANATSKVGEEEKDEGKRQEAKKVLQKYKGLQQLMNPSVFNMRRVREAKLPSANGHATATSLAEVFDAVIRSSHRNGSGEPILSKEILELARVPTSSTNQSGNITRPSMQQRAMLNDAQASFGLGWQLHEFELSNGDKGISIGHSGLGGSVVLAIPEEEVVVALTLSQLSMFSVARQRILGIIFAELGWKAPASIPVEDMSSRASCGGSVVSANGTRSKMRNRSNNRTMKKTPIRGFRQQGWLMR